MFRHKHSAFLDSIIFSVSLACHSNLMPHMQTSQTVFDELISCTPVVLEPFQSRSLCPNVNNPGSIDDFLAEYRHESSSILSFLSSLEETNTASNMSCTSKHLNSSWIQDPAIDLCMKSPRLPSSATNIEVKAETTVAESRKRSRGDKQQKSDSCSKTTLSKTDRESQEERRRRKNCEYQRRFREKKMRLELQRLYRVAFPPFAEFP